MPRGRRKNGVMWGDEFARASGYASWAEYERATLAMTIESLTQTLKTDDNYLQPERLLPYVDNLGKDYDPELLTKIGELRRLLKVAIRRRRRRVAID